jgi:hypothetical protein
MEVAAVDAAYENRGCPCCGGSGRPYFRFGEYDIEACPACRFVDVRNIPSEALAGALRVSGDLGAQPVASRASDGDGRESMSPRDVHG